ncbi:putative type IV prepilin leader peptidase [delta proteobacterium NaphS2]|nr:putative type IV prepilin leader peptidase [delta proteobacterium NaphS2]
MSMDFVLSLFSVLFGLCLGSFANVCIYRIPQNKSIVHPGSSCPHCGAGIPFYDNIPVISYLVLRGRCRRCGASISLRYPLVEMLMGLLSLALFIKFGFHLQYLLFMLFSGTLLILGFIDFDHKILPDVLTLPGILAGWLVSFFPGGISWVDSLIGLAAGGGSLYLVAAVYERITGREGLGGGDIKLLAMIGAWLGWMSLPLIVLMSSLSGAVIGSAFILSGGRGARTQIPFGPFLSMGALAYLFFGREISLWYFDLFT